MTAATRVSGDPPGGGEFVVPSRSHPGACHTVVWMGPTTHWCDCPAHHRKQTCRHVQAVAWAVETEARRMVAIATPESRAEAARRLEQIEEMFAL